MPDQPPSAATPSPANPGPTIRIGEEFGTARRNLPPLKILLLALASVVLVAGVFSFLQRVKPQAAGTLDTVVAVQIPGQSASLVALTFTLRNAPGKTLYVKTVQGRLVTSSAENTAEALSAIDLDRYYQAFPALKANSQTALAPEDKVPPGQEVRRTIVVSFPVTLEEFNQRKSISVILEPYDQPLPIILSK